MECTKNYKPTLLHLKDYHRLRFNSLSSEAAVGMQVRGRRIRPSRLHPCRRRCGLGSRDINEELSALHLPQSSPGQPSASPTVRQPIPQSHNTRRDVEALRTRTYSWCNILRHRLEKNTYSALLEQSPASTHRRRTARDAASLKHCSTRLVLRFLPRVCYALTPSPTLTFLCLACAQPLSTWRIFPGPTIRLCW